MKAWDDAVAAALLGTARRAPQPAAEAGALGTVLTAVADRPAEATLLAQAAAMAVARRAGLTLGRDDAALPDAAPDDPRPAPPEPAATHLTLLLAGRSGVLLDEWLAVAHARGFRAPYAALPELLDTGTDEDDLRAVIADLAGPRGPWLAAVRPGRWPWLPGGGTTDITDDDVLTAEDPTSRVLLLEALRATDPARARALAEQLWPAEDHETKAEILDALQANLTLDDEPFLETARRDRRKPVRLQAQMLLQRLPGSAYARALSDRARPVLTLHTGLRGARVEVAPPDALDPEIEPGKRPKGVGERAHALVELLSATPLTTWPEAMVHAKLPREWRGEVRAGWVTAAIRQRDARWAAALAELMPIPDLLDVLARADRERILAAKIADGHDAELPLHQGVWSAQLSTAVTRRIAEFAPHGDLEAILAALQPSDLDAAQAKLQPIAEQGQDWVARKVARALGLIDFRRAMLSALNQEHPT